LGRSCACGSVKQQTALHRRGAHLGVVRGHIEVWNVWSPYGGHVFSKTRTGRRNHYYRCSRRRNHGKEACANGRGIRVREVEPAVWEFVCSLLRDPNRIRQGVERLVEREEERLLRTDTNEHEVKMWARRSRELERKRSNLQDMAAEGLITFSELGTKLDAVGRHGEKLGIAWRSLVGTNRGLKT
jgi:hypothetical protein